MKAQESFRFRVSSLGLLKPKRRSGKGFTLVELVVAISVIGLLVALAFPIVGHLLGKTRQAACVSNLRQIGVALQGYLQDHDGELPEMKAMRLSKEEDVPVMDTVLLPYAGDASIFQCPADRKQIGKDSGASYWWYESVTLQSSGKHNYKVVTLESFFLGTRDLSRIPLVLDKEGFHPAPGPVNALFADGHAGPLITLNPGATDQ